MMMADGDGRSDVVINHFLYITSGLRERERLEAPNDVKDDVDHKGFFIGFIPSWFKNYKIFRY